MLYRERNFVIWSMPHGLDIKQFGNADIFNWQNSDLNTIHVH